MSEKLKNRGRLEMKRLEAQQIKLRLETLRDAIRDELDPFERLDKVDSEKVATLADDFDDQLRQYREALKEIEELKKAI